MPVIIEPLGDHALTVTLGEIIDEKINKKVLALFHYLQQKNIEEVKDYIPAYASLTVVYDIALIKKQHALSSFEYMHSLIEDALRNFDDNAQQETTLLHIPVCYDVSLGIDLEEMAVQKNITV